jgi:hypothetical protein
MGLNVRFKRSFETYPKPRLRPKSIETIPLTAETQQMAAM